MKILINRTDAIGDNLLTMPMAKAIKKKYPQAHISILTSPLCADLYVNHPYVDDCFVLNKKASFFTKFYRTSKLFSEHKWDTYFYVGGTHVPSFVAWLKRIKFRGGLVSRLYSFLFLNKGIRQKRSFVTEHESEYNLSLLSPLGIEYHVNDYASYAPEIELSQTELQSALEDFKADLEQAGLDYSKLMERKSIFIHPGMTGHTLNWSSRNYARLIQRLEEHYPGKYLYVVSHTPGDLAYLEGLKDQLEEGKKKEQVYFFDGSLHGLRHFMAVLSRAALFIGPSTGPTHIANALGVKQIGLYSPIKVQSSLRWGPYLRSDERVKVIVPDVVCGEAKYCALESCPYYECMAKIEVEDVLSVAKELLESE